MASLQPKSRMPKPGGKPWRARVKLDGLEYFLGSFSTKEAAEATEQQFRDANEAETYPQKSHPKESQL